MPCACLAVAPQPLPPTPVPCSSPTPGRSLVEHAQGVSAGSGEELRPRAQAAADVAADVAPGAEKRSSSMNSNAVRPLDAATTVFARARTGRKRRGELDSREAVRCRHAEGELMCDGGLGLTCCAVSRRMGRRPANVEALADDEARRGPSAYRHRRRSPPRHAIVEPRDHCRRPKPAGSVRPRPRLSAKNRDRAAGGSVSSGQIGVATSP
jgi:hypothetical protein